MDDSRQIGQSAPSVDSQAAVGAYYQPIGTGDDVIADGTLPAEPVLPSASPAPVQPAVPETTPAMAVPEVTPSVSAPVAAPLGFAPVESSSSAPQTPSVAPVNPPSSAPTSNDSVVTQMQRANQPKGNSKKVLLFALIAGAVVILGFVAWFFVTSSNSQEKITPLPITEQTNNAAVEPSVEESLQQAGIVTQAAEPLEQPRNTQVVTEGEAAVDLNATEPIALVSGKVCPYGKEFPAGKVIFYDNEQNKQIVGDLPADQGTYTFTVPVGKYTSFFVPTDTNLPVFAYTDYVPCGMNPTECTNHTLLVGEYEAESQYGQVNLCDPQYDQAGLPESLTYENK